MATNIVTVEFAGTQLVGQIHKGGPYVAMKPVVEGMGLDWDRQLARLKNHPVLARKLTLLKGGNWSPDGKRYEMLCLPHSRLAFWLATVNPSKVKAAIRDRVVLFQEHAADVLHEAFTAEQGKQALRGEAIAGKRAAARLLTDVLQDVAELDGREVGRWDYANEHRLCNYALRGSFDPIDENTLTAEEASALASIRRREAVLVVKGVPREERKVLLVAHADRIMDRAPLALPAGGECHAA